MGSSASAVTVCVVDDDASVRTALALLIEAHGWSARCFDSAEAFLANGDTDAAFLVLDLNLQGMDGAALLEHLQARGHCPPTIVLTAFPDGPLAGRARAAGAQRILAKPAGITALISDLGRVLPRMPGP